MNAYYANTRVAYVIRFRGWGIDGFLDKTRQPAKVSRAAIFESVDSALAEIARGVETTRKQGNADDAAKNGVSWAIHRVVLSISDPLARPSFYYNVVVGPEVWPSVIGRLAQLA